MKKNCKWKTSLIGQANGRKVVYLSADPNVCPLKGQFPLLCWILHNATKCYSNNMIEGKFSVYMFFKTNYIWILLWYNRLKNSNFCVKHWKTKNEKLLHDIQTKCSHIANETLNVVINTEWTFKCKWPTLFYCLLSLPLSTTCIERLFSNMKFIKTQLRNNLSQSTLENLLFIVTEAWEDFNDDHYKYFVNELKRLTPNIRIQLWCFL